MRPLALLVLALTFTLPRIAAAQFEELQPGSRVRVSAPGTVAGRLTGVVIARTRDSLTIAPENHQVLTLPVEALRSVEVSRGKDRLAGARRGSIWGAAAGVAMSATMPIDCDGQGHGIDCTNNGARPSQAVYYGRNALAGAVVGAAIGALLGVERWERFGTPVRPHIVARGVGLSIPF